MCLRSSQKMSLLEKKKKVSSGKPLIVRYRKGEGTLGVEANGGMQGTRALGWGRPVVISAGPSASVTLSRFINL